jgi:SAM-dependent methyltransferase
MPTPPRYDGLAAWYDRYVQSAEVTSIALGSLEFLLSHGPGQCLDIGCGTGMAFPVLAALSWTIVGVDVSGDQLAVAADRAASMGAQLVQADATHLPFPDGSFDSVVSVLTHTDFDDPSAVFREAARVLRSGGSFVYVGVHPCFGGPMVERPTEAPPILHPGYRRSGWWRDGFGDGVRSRVGVNHMPLGEFLSAVMAPGFRLERVVEPGPDDDYPTLLALHASRVSDSAETPTRRAGVAELR